MKRRNSRIKLAFLLIFLFCCIFVSVSSTVSASSDKPRFVVLGGDAIGLRLETEVYVTGKFEVTTSTGKVKPWINGNIAVDDIIVSLNNQPINGIEDIRNIVKGSDEGYISIKVKRNNEIIESNILVVTNIKNENTIGLYVKDKILGVGTLTYYDIKTKSFGALGHQAIMSD